MKTNPHTRSSWFTVLLILVSAIGLAGCDSNDSEEIVIDLDDRDTLLGTYRLVSLLDKSGDLLGIEDVLFEAGEPTTVTVTEGDETYDATVTVDGELMLTDDRFQVEFAVSITTVGLPPFSFTDEDEGTWSITGNTLTLNSDSPDDGGPEQLQISASGNRITLETEDGRFVFEQQ